MHSRFRAAQAACAAALLFALPASAQQMTTLELESEAPAAEFFENEPGRTWLSHCDYEADRYIVCKFAEPRIIEAIEHPKTTAGAAMQDVMRSIFEKKGCSFEAPPETFRVNGIFLSFDTEGGKKIACDDAPSKVLFKPGVISFLDTIYFFRDARPQ